MPKPAPHRDIATLPTGGLLPSSPAAVTCYHLQAINNVELVAAIHLCHLSGGLELCRMAGHEKCPDAPSKAWKTRMYLLLNKKKLILLPTAYISFLEFIPRSWTLLQRLDLSRVKSLARDHKFRPSSRKLFLYSAEGFTGGIC